MRCTSKILWYLTLTRSFSCRMDALELWASCSDFERSIIARMANK